LASPLLGTWLIYPFSALVILELLSLEIGNTKNSLCLRGSVYPFQDQMSWVRPLLLTLYPFNFPLFFYQTDLWGLIKFYDELEPQ
jgi:hypothetical protein